MDAEQTETSSSVEGEVRAAEAAPPAAAAAAAVETETKTPFDNANASPPLADAPDAAAPLETIAEADDDGHAGTRKRKPEEDMDDDNEPRKQAKTGEIDEEEDDDDDEEEEDATPQQVTYMLKDGKLRKDGKIDGATLHVQGKKSFTVESGEAILSLRLANPEANESTPHPALVVGFYSRDEGKNFTTRVRWLITAEELDALPKELPWKGLSRSKVIKDMGENDVVLSPQVDDLPVESILDKASVKLHWMYDDDNSPKQSKLLSADVPPGTYTCQYQLKFDVDNSIHLDYVRLGTANDLEGTASQLNLSSAHGSHSSIDTRSYNGAQGDSSDEEGGEATDEDEKRVVAEGEGSNLRTSIAVGSNFQASVPPFRPNAAHTVSRRPAKAVWKPGTVSEETLSEFLESAAQILNEYIEKNNLASNEPYSPIPIGAAEKIMKDNPESLFLTGSTLSTGSVLKNSKRNALLKECDIDRLMERLWECEGDVSKALTLIKQEPTRFVCAWAPFEKEIFNENFRRHHGAIRKIAKAVAPFKTIQEVVDYQFRFKIPDQFRLFQERKREIALRIVECIDNRRVLDPTTEIRRRPLGSSASHWSEANPSDLVQYTESRREKARQLMLDVHATLGKSVTGQVANAVKELNRSDTLTARAELFSLLNGYTDLQRRFNEFLPKQA